MYKVGDKVVCVKNNQEKDKFNLELGKVYTISKVTEWDSIKLLELNTPLSYDPARFILASHYVPNDPSISPVIKKLRLMEKRRKQYYETV